MNFLLPYQRGAKAQQKSNLFLCKFCLKRIQRRNLVDLLEQNEVTRGVNVIEKIVSKIVVFCFVQF